MTGWWSAFEVSERVAFIGAVALLLNALLSSVIAILVVRMSNARSERDAQRSVNSSDQNFKVQSSLLSNIEIAKMRQNWVNDISEKLAEYGRKQTANFFSLQANENFVESAQYEYNYLLLKINQEEKLVSIITSEMNKLQEILDYYRYKRQDIDNDVEKEFQKTFAKYMVSSNIFLKSEWDKIKGDLEQFSSFEPADVLKVTA
ncbi:MAG: hypothetical protein AAFQ10_02865 [Pseudomonadota bacterium]